MPKYIMIQANNEFNGQEMMFNLFLMTNVFRDAKHVSNDGLQNKYEH